MRVYLLDTNIVSDLVRNPRGQAALRVRRLVQDRIATSIIVAAELRYGAAKRGSIHLARQLETVFNDLVVEPFDMPADRHYGNLRAQLEAIGRPIGPHDLFIAAHALALGAVLVSANTNEFARVPGLAVANWLA